MTEQMSRRKFGQFLGLAAGASAFSTTPRIVHAEAVPELSSAQQKFPDGFLWGSATASYQVEGAVHDDGRGLRSGIRFQHMPGKTHDGDTGDVADRLLPPLQGRHRADVDLGLKSYRFSIAWSRIFPKGTGARNPKGFDYYDRMLDVLLEAKIDPFCTLYHWDLPQTLQDKGGWQNRDTAKAFADYAAVCRRASVGPRAALHDDERDTTFVELGYQTGHTCPGPEAGCRAGGAADHYAVLAHGLAVQAIRAHAQSGNAGGHRRQRSGTHAADRDAGAY